MLAANVCAAEFLKHHKHPALYRNHAGPTSERLNTLREQLSLLGLHLNGGNTPTPKDYAELSEKIKERPDQNVISIMLLRSMQQAVYEPQNIGHFGLAYPAYTHFTSPIRRYPDLTVHRAIKAILQHKQYQPKSWSELGVHCSLAERRADNASRDVQNWLKTYYMQDKIGEVFSGTISGMANFGLFVTLDNVYIDGMVHISDLGEDYFNYHPEMLAIVGERSGIRFKLGDKVVVKVARADLDTSRIDLVLISTNSGKRRRTNNAQNIQKQLKATVKQPRKAPGKKTKSNKTKTAAIQKSRSNGSRKKPGRKKS